MSDTSSRPSRTGLRSPSSDATTGHRDLRPRPRSRPASPVLQPREVCPSFTNADTPSRLSFSDTVRSPAGTTTPPPSGTGIVNRSIAPTFSISTLDISHPCVDPPCRPTTASPSCSFVVPAESNRTPARWTGMPDGSGEPQPQPCRPQLDDRYDNVRPNADDLCLFFRLNTNMLPPCYVLCSLSQFTFDSPPCLGCLSRCSLPPILLGFAASSRRSSPQ